MKIHLILLVLIGTHLSSFGQAKVQFKKVTTTIKEPYGKSRDTIQRFAIELLLTDGNLLDKKYTASLIQVAPSSTYPKDKIKLVTTKIENLEGTNQILVDIATDMFSDIDKMFIINVNYENSLDPEPVKLQFSDTILVRNTYPFKLVEPEEYTPWHDGKKVEVFIGTNFDFFGNNTVTDWYGGISVFLPGITDLKYKRGKSTNDSRWGLNAGLYHSKSFSNYGTLADDEKQIITRKTLRQYVDTINNVIVPATDYRRDTINIKDKIEINNWGAYGGVMYQISRFQPQKESFVTNIFLGVHAEIIRRNVSTTYEFDTVGRETVTVYGTRPLFRDSSPVPVYRSYFDSYFGINMPVQFLWKDIIDLKLTPCFGLGDASYASSRSRVPSFYLFNFDLLARLGGIRLMVGGEIRGYFSNSAIFSAYLGTSLPISKITDFLSK